MSHTLTRTQKIELAALWTTAGLQDADIQQVRLDSASYLDPPTDAVVHPPTDTYFIFDEHIPGRMSRRPPGGFDIRLYPDHNGQVNTIGPLEWSEVLRLFSEWAKRVRVEHEAPDWRELVGVPSGTSSEARAVLVQASTSDSEDAPFTPAERAQLAARIDALTERFVETNQPSAQVAAELRSEFAGQLKDGLGRLNRKQWLRFAVGTLVTVGVKIGLETEAVHELAEGLTAMVRGLLGS